MVLSKHAKVIPDLTGLPKSEEWENLELTMCKSGVNNIGKKKSYIAFFFFFSNLETEIRYRWLEVRE